MRLQAVADAVFVGGSLEPFAGIDVDCWIDAERRTHLDPHCPHTTGAAQRSIVTLNEVHLHLRCPMCATNLSVPAGTQWYGEACESLARCRDTVDTAGMQYGIDALRSAIRALAFEADAAGVVAGDERRRDDVERVGARLRRRAWGVLECHRPAGDNLVRWAASFAVPAPTTDGGVTPSAFEQARTGLRLGDRRPLSTLVGPAGANAWLDGVDEVLSAGPWRLCEVVIDGSDRSLIAALAVEHRVDRYGRTFGVCPDWLRACTTVLHLPVACYEAVAETVVVDRQVELFAELARRMPAHLAASAGRRLGGRRHGLAFCTDLPACCPG